MKHILIFIGFLCLFSQSPDYRQQTIEFRKKQNAIFKSGDKSPLSQDDKKEFVALKYYPYDPEYVVEANFTPVDDNSTIQVTTTMNQVSDYEKYGYLDFNLKGESYRLLVMYGPQYRNHPEYHNFLSLYFTDQTNGDETYEVGRYLELRAPLKKKVVLNFNNTYNPYCAYRYGYSCPIPPKENHLNTKLQAGVKKGILKKKRF